jgi:hypothetical protein
MPGRRSIGATIDQGVEEVIGEPDCATGQGRPIGCAGVELPGQRLEAVQRVFQSRLPANIGLTVKAIPAAGSRRRLRPARDVARLRAGITEWENHRRASGSSKTQP